VERGTLFFTRWTGEECLGVGGEVIAAVRGVETFREDDNLRPFFRSLEDLFPGVGEIVGFIRTYLYPWSAQSINPS
jgi:hypothetical protein